MSHDGENTFIVEGDCRFCLRKNMMCVAEKRIQDLKDIFASKTQQVHATSAVNEGPLSKKDI
jgi:hypothetical protein